MGRGRTGNALKTRRFQCASPTLLQLYQQRVPSLFSPMEGKHLNRGFKSDKDDSAVADPGVCVHKVARDTSSPGQVGLGGWRVRLEKWSWAGLREHECQAKKLKLYQAGHRGAPEGSEQSSQLIRQWFRTF